MSDINNLYNNLTNFYNVNDENFKEFMANIYKEMLANHKDIKYVKEHFKEEIEKKLDEYLVDGKIKVNIREVVDEFLNNSDAINDINAQLEQKALQSDLIIERNRINNLIIHSGEGTEKDAELIDTRIDFQGNTHTTTGECVRSQAEEIFNYAKVIGSQISIDIFDGIWKQGYVNENTGLVVTAPKNLTTGLYVKKPNESFEVSLEEKIKWIGVYFYNGTNPVPVSKKEVNNANYLQFKIPANADSFAIVVGSDTNITPETMMDFHILDRNNIVDLLVEDLNIFDNKFVQGYIYETTGNIKI